MCDWPSCSDSTLHALELVTLPDPNYHKSAIIVAKNGSSDMMQVLQYMMYNL